MLAEACIRICVKYTSIQQRHQLQFSIYQIYNISIGQTLYFVQNMSETFAGFLQTEMLRAKLSGEAGCAEI